MDNLENLIPDFDEMQEHLLEVGKLKARLIVCNAELKQLEARLYVEAMTNKDYWREGKKPTATYCKEVVKVIGNTEAEAEALLNSRRQLAQVTEALTLHEGFLTMKRDQLDLFRTLSANDRKGFA